MLELAARASGSPRDTREARSGPAKSRDEGLSFHLLPCGSGTSEPAQESTKLGLGCLQAASGWPFPGRSLPSTAGLGVED